ncbi:PREDICTED: signal-regulatory protein beta-1-like [Tinamus guttatus]|uniref:signal-regulatory protein beta-1-like n=1 Tax=Tinamus guttatus TaxID=94827 RepID=UPI00052EC00C|nr:PREDICTED: signal-regulatory protein beta-1-like [Tinamus guttatus]
MAGAVSCSGSLRAQGVPNGEGRLWRWRKFLCQHPACSEGFQAVSATWLRASGGRNHTVYDQKSSWSRVARATNGSNTDFTILIRDARPDDAGTYYCVKERPGTEDQVACSGGGTTVSVHVTRSRRMD